MNRLTAIFLVVSNLTMMVLVGFLVLHHPSTTPPPEPSVVKLATSYSHGVPILWHDVAKQVRAKQLKDKKSVTDALSKGWSDLAKPLGSALDRQFAAYTDDAGSIEQPNEAADLLDQAATAMERK